MGREEGTEATWARGGWDGGDVCKVPKATGLGARCQDPEGDLGEGHEEHLWRSIAPALSL